MTLPTAILAGGTAKPDLQALIGESNRALAMVNGKTLLRHVVDAILSGGPGNGRLGPITVIGDLPDDPSYARLPDNGDFVSNILAGLTAHRDAPFVLIATSDLPFLTGAAVAAFVRDALALAQSNEAGLIWPVVPVNLCYARFPGIRRTALRLRDGEYTGGNVALVRPKLLLDHRDRIATAYAARKSPAQLAKLLGMETLVRLALSQKLSPNLLSIGFLETRVSKLLGGACRALPCNSPEIATDLDRPSDFAAIRAAGASVPDSSRMP